MTVLDSLLFFTELHVLQVMLHSSFTHQVRIRVSKSFAYHLAIDLKRYVIDNLLTTGYITFEHKRYIIYKTKHITPERFRVLESS